MDVLLSDPSHLDFVKCPLQSPARSSLSPSAGVYDQCRILLRTGSLDVLGAVPSAEGAPSDHAEEQALPNRIAKES
ncbi:hypothetical protein Nepgr_032287 [Nepenthes gracilis]|uniref:Uncharacterized protein n=1 Tax=Nepenthes gracilis TaxID=150966 RepID=A0AAD3TJP5_NEPGR|nr:hypothetical protein Nepgr_032287 [Nepenthes gracilis]